MNGPVSEPEEPGLPPWWMALAGGFAFAGFLAGLAWLFALIGWVMEALA